MPTDLDVGGGALVDQSGFRYLGPDSPCPAVLLTTLLASVGTGGDEAQEALAAILAAWFEQAHAANVGFHRDAAVVHTIVVTDGDDASANPDLETFVADYAGLGADPTFTVFGDMDDATVYEQVADDLDGAVLAAAEIASLAGALGVKVGGYATEFHLSLLPVPGTIEVTVTEASGALLAFADGWSYDPSRNSVTFLDYLPPPNSTIRLTYLPAAAATAEEPLPLPPYVPKG